MTLLSWSTVLVAQWIQGTQIFLCPTLMLINSHFISDSIFFATVKPLLGQISKILRQPFFTNCSLVLRETRIYIISISLIYSVSAQAISCHYVNGLTILYTYTPKVLVKKFNISVDYFQCEKFIVIFFYCHTKIQTCISEKIERKKICSWHWHSIKITNWLPDWLTYFIKL